MKKDGYAESTIKTTGRRLRMMVRHGVNLNDPEAVKEYIAAKESSNGYKEVLCDVYDRYAKYNGLTWRRPRYERDDQPPYVPTQEEANLLIANAGKKYAWLNTKLVASEGYSNTKTGEVHLRYFAFH